MFLRILIVKFLLLLNKLFWFSRRDGVFCLVNKLIYIYFIYTFFYHQNLSLNEYEFKLTMGWMWNENVGKCWLKIKNNDPCLVFRKKNVRGGRGVIIRSFFIFSFLLSTLIAIFSTISIPIQTYQYF